MFLSMIFKNITVNVRYSQNKLPALTQHMNLLLADM